MFRERFLPLRYVHDTVAAIVRATLILAQREENSSSRLLKGVVGVSLERGNL